ncbi:hypothetical protein [Kitasatospora sp. NPDC059673]|uniref:hypothetical protein n=1 Tax=Kitasatospora sp. NPDC059673 TaxID=3346901 RepID=UPI0036B545D5
MSATATTSPPAPARQPTRPARPLTPPRRRATDADADAAGTAAQPLCTNLDRTNLDRTTLDRTTLPTLTDADHQAVRDLTHHLDPDTPLQVMSRLEHTRTAAAAPPRGTEPAPAARPVVRRGRL